MDPVYIARAVKALQAQDPNITVLESGDVISEAYLDAAFEAAAQTLALNVSPLPRLSLLRLRYP